MIDNWINADAAWQTGGFFRPRLAFVCGNCHFKWETKSYVYVTNQGDRLADVCPSCNRWNLSELALA